MMHACTVGCSRVHRKSASDASVREQTWSLDMGRMCGLSTWDSAWSDLIQSQQVRLSELTDTNTTHSHGSAYNVYTHEYNHNGLTYSEHVQ